KIATRRPDAPSRDLPFAGDSMITSAISLPDATERRAIPPTLLMTCRVLFCVAIAYLLTEILTHDWIYNRRRRHPHGFRQCLDRGPARARRPTIARLGLGHPEAAGGRAAAAGFQGLFGLALSAAILVHRSAARAVSLCGGAGRLGFCEHAALSRGDAGDR